MNPLILRHKERSERLDRASIGRPSSSADPARLCAPRPRLSRPALGPQATPKSRPGLEKWIKEDNVMNRNPNNPVRMEMPDPRPDGNERRRREGARTGRRANLTLTNFWGLCKTKHPVNQIPSGLGKVD